MNFENNRCLRQYIFKINLVQDYIEQHLGEYLTIEKLSSMVNFSQYYFHRLFKSITKESLYSYVKRLRLEKAVFFLNYNIDKSITEIALSVGFSNQASFAKAFKKAYGISANEYRKSKNGQLPGNNGKVMNSLACYDINDMVKVHINKNCVIDPYSIEIIDKKPRSAIYLRHTAYEGSVDLFYKLFSELNRWAKARNLVKMDSNWQVLYHAKGDFTKNDKLRVSVCLEVDKDINAEETVGKYVLPEGKYVIGRFEILHSDLEYQKAWDYMLFKWLPQSGYKVDERISFKEYSTNINFGLQEKNTVNIYIPISPL